MVSVNLAVALAMRTPPDGSSGPHAAVEVRLLDCDVEEPNVHLFLRPQFTQEFPVSLSRPRLIADRCTGCGKCANTCQYNAIAVAGGRAMVFDDLCRACGVCSYVCPTGAMQEERTEVGTVRVADTSRPIVVQGCAEIGQSVSPFVIAAVRKHVDPMALNIIDAPPGTTCLVVRAVEGADMALLVTEPTPFGLHDLKLAVALTRKLAVPTAIVINQSGGNDAIILEFAREVGLPVAGRIPFKREYAEACSAGSILVDIFPDMRETMLGIYDNLAPRISRPVTEETFRLTGPAADHHDARPTTADPGRAAGATREIVVISGKGGTGKTTITAALAQLANRPVIADTDVDAADLHLLFTPVVREEHEFFGMPKSVIDSEKCTGCGRCAQVCRFNAVLTDGQGHGATGSSYRVDPLQCEGCGMCTLVCPVGAIDSCTSSSGSWYVSDTAAGPMVHAQLGVAQENSGRLVTLVRKRAAELAREITASRILTDGPPGTGCPVTASVTGTDLVVIVTEPTVSGVHDLERVLRLADHFGVPAVVIINKADINVDQAARIESIATSFGSRVVGTIPFDENVRAAAMAGKTLVDFGRGRAAKSIPEIWLTISTHVSGNRRLSVR